MRYHENECSGSIVKKNLNAIASRICINLSGLKCFTRQNKFSQQRHVSIEFFYNRMLNMRQVFTLTRKILQLDLRPLYQEKALLQDGIQGCSNCYGKIPRATRTEKRLLSSKPPILLLCCSTFPCRHPSSRQHNQHLEIEVLKLIFSQIYNCNLYCRSKSFIIYGLFHHTRHFELDSNECGRIFITLNVFYS